MCIGRGENVVGIEESDKWFESFVNQGRIVNDGSVWCKMYIMEVLCATCISQNRGGITCMFIELSLVNIQ